MSAEVFLNNKRILLEERDFVAEGGEGRIYGKGDCVFKLYADKTRTISRAKVDELSVLDHPAILRPLDMLFDKCGSPIGFTMQWQRNTVPICKLFTNDFRNRNNMGNAEVAELVENMFRIFELIHRKGCLVVDANEMNFLVDGARLVSPYFIDVDSYQTPRFPATAIMDSIRDYSAAAFSEMSDWFAFAIVATQLFIGIHPYKGTHPAYGKGELKRRMQDNVSVFNKDVRLPAAVRDFTVIPHAYRDWLERVLEKGERLAPPSNAGAINLVMPVVKVMAMARFVIELVREFPSRIITMDEDFVICGDTIYNMSGSALGKAASGTEIIRTPGGRHIMAWSRDGVLALASVSGGSLAIDVAARALMVCGDMLVAIGGEHAVVLGLEEFGDRVIPCIKGQWDVLPNATLVLDGLLYQDVLGTSWLNIFYTTLSGKAACLFRHFKELDDYRVLEARYRNRVAMVLGERSGQYDLITYKFTADFTEASCTVESDVPYHVPNFVVLDNGTAIQITGDDELLLFSNDPRRREVKAVRESGISMEMRLCLANGRVCFAVGSKVYSFRMAT